MMKALPALVASASLFLSIQAPAGATSNRTLEWNGQLNRSCSLSAVRNGTVGLSSDRQWLTSEEGTPAVLGYTTVGGTATITSTDSSVLRNGADALGNNQNADLYLGYGSTSNWHQVWQNRQVSRNQRGHDVTGTGNLNVHTRTNAHRDSRGDVQTGTYIVRSTVTCTVK